MNLKLSKTLYKEQDDIYRECTLIPDEDDPIKYVAVCTGRQVGKDLRNDSLLYYNGYVGTIGDCSVGDSIYGDDGKLTTILAKYPQGVKAQYAVTLADGRIINCGLEHQHSVITNKGISKVVDTEYIMNNYISSRNKPEKLYIPTAKAVEYSSRDHIIPPYIMGILIAEGSLTSSQASFSTGDIDIIQKIKSLIDFEVKLKGNTVYDYTILTNGLYNNEIRRFKLNVKAENKHIPEEYLYDSVANRIELLRGLMDGDGTISIKGNMEYNTASNTLALDFLNLIRSLGMKGYSKSRTSFYTYKGAKLQGLNSHRIRIFSNDINPFNLPRKVIRFKSNPKFNHQYRTAIIDVKRIEDAESTCITVDNKSSCFLTTDYTVTHNTLTGIVICLNWAFQANSNILIVSPTYKQSKKILRQFEKTLKPFIRTKKVTVNKTELGIRFWNGSEITLVSGESKDSVRGNSITHLWVDEAAFIQDDVFESAIEPVVIAVGRIVLLTSTPKGKKSYFYKIFKSDTSKTFTFSSETSPLIKKADLDVIKKKLPPLIYRQEYMAEFIEDGGEVFSNVNKNSTISKWIDPIEGETYYAGIDWGNKADSSVLTIMDKYGRTVFIRSITGSTYTLITEQFAEDLIRYNSPFTYSEENSIGEVANELLSKHYGNFEAITLNNENKGAMIVELIEAFNNNEIKIPVDELYSDMNYELSVFTFNILPSKKIQYAAPPGKHDDNVISLAYANKARKNNANTGNIQTYKNNDSFGDADDELNSLIGL